MLNTSNANLFANAFRWEGQLQHLKPLLFKLKLKRCGGGERERRRRRKRLVVKQSADVFCRDTYVQFLLQTKCPV